MATESGDYAFLKHTAQQIDDAVDYVDEMKNGNIVGGGTGENTYTKKQIDSMLAQKADVSVTDELRRDIDALKHGDGGNDGGGGGGGSPDADDETDGIKIKEVTQSEYEILAKDEKTLYIITIGDGSFKLCYGKLNLSGIGSAVTGQILMPHTPSSVVGCAIPIESEEG